MSRKSYVIDVNLQALDKYGIKAQADQMIEECAELTVALRHFFRGKASADEVQSELADVIAMQIQMLEFFGPDEVSEKLVAKANRMLDRMRSAQDITREEYLRLKAARMCSDGSGDA